MLSPKELFIETFHKNKINKHTYSKKSIGVEESYFKRKILKQKVEKVGYRDIYVMNYYEDKSSFYYKISISIHDGVGKVDGQYRFNVVYQSEPLYLHYNVSNNYSLYYKYSDPGLYTFNYG